MWDAACVLWGHIPAAEYRKAIIGLIFLRYISSAFDKRYKQKGVTTGGSMLSYFSKNGILYAKTMGKSVRVGRKVVKEGQVHIGRVIDKENNVFY